MSADRTDTPRILVIGDVMTDIIVRPDGPPIAGADRSARIEARAGGSGANTACWLAAEGASVVFAGRVGRADAEAQRHSLQACGVRAALATDAERPTGTTITLVAPDGERSFLTDRGANDGLCEADLRDDLLDGIALLHISGYALFGEGPRRAVLRLLRLGRERGIPFSVDAASHSRLAEVGAAAFLSWIAGAEWLFANADEAAVLSGRPDPDGQIAALAPHASAVIVKRGATGALIALEGGRERFAVAAPDTKAVDTTGAGDAFVAGLLAAKLRCASSEESLERAVELGAYATTIIGGRPGPVNPLREGA